MQRFFFKRKAKLDLFFKKGKKVNYKEKIRLRLTISNGVHGLEMKVHQYLYILVSDFRVSFTAELLLSSDSLVIAIEVPGTVKGQLSRLPYSKTSHDFQSDFQLCS